MIETIHLIATAIMTGVIWIIQLVHYPSFKHIDKNQFKEAMEKHQRGITPFVMPMMLLELGTAFYLCFNTSFEIGWIFNLVLLLIIWASTFFVQVPLHQSLVSGYDLGKIDSLARGNWVRTVLWTVRLFLVFSI